MILNGVSYSAFIQLCRVRLSPMMNPTVVSLQSSDDILEVSLKYYGSIAWLSQRAMARFL